MPEMVRPMPENALSCTYILENYNLGVLFEAVSLYGSRCLVEGCRSAYTCVSEGLSVRSDLFFMHLHN